MSFQPDADPNYQAFLAQRNRYSADLAGEYETAFIQYLCAQAIAGVSTINGTMIANAVRAAWGAAGKKKSPTF